MKHTFEFITEQATSDKGFSKRDRVSFHAFNPNGLYAKKKEMDKLISKLVNQKKVPSGWIIAYGSMNNYHTESLMKLVGKKKNINRITLAVLLEGIQDQINKAQIKINQLEKGN